MKNLIKIFLIVFALGVVTTSFALKMETDKEVAVFEKDTIKDLKLIGFESQKIENEKSLVCEILKEDFIFYDLKVVTNKVMQNSSEKQGIIPIIVKVNPHQFKQKSNNHFRAVNTYRTARDGFSCI